MELASLISAVEDYINIKNRTGDLTNVRPENILDDSSQRLGSNPYKIPTCSKQDKQKFDKAKQKVEDILNSYIDERVKVVIESMK